MSKSPLSLHEKYSALSLPQLRAASAREYKRIEDARKKLAMIHAFADHKERLAAGAPTRVPTAPRDVLRLVPALPPAPAPASNDSDDTGNGAD